MLPFIIFFLAIIIILIVCNVHVVPQAKVYIVQRLGSYHTTWSNGIHFKIPIFDKVAKKISIKEQVLDFPPQPVITKDNVTIHVDSIVFYNITDAKLYTYGIEHPISAIEGLTTTTLRSIIGGMELDQTLSSRDNINSKITTQLDIDTDKWGIKVNRVEIKNIVPPREIQDAMEKQMKAERERREAILRAEGEKTSKILVAEGNKESQILHAQAEKEAAILRADAQREKMIREGQGEAEAIMIVQKALADSIEMLNASAPNERILALKSFESMEKIANGNATKIIIPSDMQSMAGVTTTLSELFKGTDK